MKWRTNLEINLGILESIGSGWAEMEGSKSVLLNSNGKIIIKTGMDYSKGN